MTSELENMGNKTQMSVKSGKACLALWSHRACSRPWPKGSDQEVMPAGKPPRSESSAAICVPLSTSPQVPEVTNVQNRKPTVQVFSSTILPSTSQIRITTCKAELQRLIQQKREQCSAERIAKQMMGNAEWESKPPPPGW
ncbi:PREDICTED: phosphoinositide 3-kinase regulatory subunit 4-like [Capra hircus]|uniref:phosphoinositide 3-kinase regulatory subunit 4-like n=1 Tax=Capra hircus TaxID=9925 RepID=UPI0008476E76|nr:PREDICTED: phosphoinositide 3-kinase regulatory subunit 4-like [Capra hircus]